MKIVTINCTNCSGRGYHETKTTTTVEIRPGVILEHEIVEREDCRECDGIGIIQISSED